MELRISAEERERALSPHEIARFANTPQTAVQHDETPGRGWPIAGPSPLPKRPALVLDRQGQFKKMGVNALSLPASLNLKPAGLPIIVPDPAPHASADAVARLM